MTSGRKFASLIQEITMNVGNYFLVYLTYLFLYSHNYFKWLLAYFMGDKVLQS